MFSSEKEKEFFLSNIKKTDKVLEYGSGYSTKLISDLCEYVLSIEHQENWYNKLKQDLSNNAEIILKKPNTIYFEGTICGTYEQFKDYIEEPLNRNIIFDIVLIDGRARVECAKFIHNVCDENSIIFIHDYSSRSEDHHRYKEVLSYLDLIESVEDMSKFKLKSNV
jgi:hypothetical protein